MKKTLFTFLVILISIGLVSADPGILVTATAVDNSGLPGEEATFDVTVQSLDFSIKTVELSITDLSPGWSSSFNPSSMPMGPPYIASSDLSITISPLASEGVYTYTILAEEYVDPDDPFYFLCPPVGPCASTSGKLNVIVEGPISAPEFPAAAVPLAIMAIAPAFGYLLIRRRQI